MTDGAIHEMSQMLGELIAGQRAIDSKIDQNHSEAGRQWELIHSEIRNVKHAQNNLEQADIGHVYALRRMGEKLEPLEKLPEAVAAVDRRVAAVEVVNIRVEAMEDRLGKIDRLMLKVTILGGGAAGLASVIAAVTMHYGASIIHWFTGRP